MAETNNKYIFPIIVGLGIIGVILLIASTDIMSPVIEYIHTNSITPIGAIGCIVAAIAFFYLIYKLLIKLGKSLLPSDEAGKK